MRGRGGEVRGERADVGWEVRGERWQLRGDM